MALPAERPLAEYNEFAHKPNILLRGLSELWLEFEAA